MKTQYPEHIIKFLKENVEPLSDDYRGAGYRASAYLTDGTYLPCVMFRNPKETVNLAIRRFKEEKSGKGVFGSLFSGDRYKTIVQSFVTKGNCLNDYDIDRVEISRFAIPASVLSQVHGETSMGWTGFAAEMNDGKYVGFGTAYYFDFFDLPENNSFNDVKQIINHSYVIDTGELRSLMRGGQRKPDDYQRAVIYRERPYFECYMENL